MHVPSCPTRTRFHEWICMVRLVLGAHSIVEARRYSGFRLMLVA